jgi:hypothetical protein
MSGLALMKTSLDEISIPEDSPSPKLGHETDFRLDPARWRMGDPIGELRRKANLSGTSATMALESWLLGDTPAESG